MNLPHILLVAVVFPTMLIVLVGAHEMGHYLFARLFGMATEEFAIGMFGKPLVVLGKRRYTIPLRPGDDPGNRGEPNPLEGGATAEPTEVVETPNGRLLRETTVFTIRPWPVGGFVRIKGMIPQEDGGETRVPGGFFSKAPWKRWVVLAAGPAFSMIAGVLLLIPVLTIQGVQKPTGRPVVADLIVGDPADKGGLKPKDRIVSVDGTTTSTWFDVLSNVRDKGEKPIALVIERDGKRLEKTVVGRLDESPTDVADAKGEPTGERRVQTKLGMSAEWKQASIPFGEAVGVAVKMPYRSAMDLIGKLSHPAELKKSVGGPGTMIMATSASVDQGFGSIMTLAALLSISLGIFNLLPFPPLDGGQMWIAFVEMLRGGRRLSMRTQVRVINVGFAFVLMLICTVLVIDVQRWVFPESAADVKGR